MNDESVRGQRQQKYFSHFIPETVQGSVQKVGYVQTLSMLT